MKPKTRRAVMVVLTALVPVMTSCAAGRGRPQGPPPLGPVPVVHTAADLVLPLDAYAFTNKDYATKARAQARLTADCMHRFGVDYPAETGPLVPGVTVPDFDHLNDRRYGLIDADSAAVRGYRVPHPPEQGAQAGRPAGADPDPQVLFLLDGRAQPAFAHAALPTDTKGQRLPVDGCTGEAARALSGRVAGDLQLAQTLATEAFREAENDSRLRPVTQAWSRCMSARGYTYTTIWQPNNRQWPDPVGPAEIATATADVACKLQTNLPGTWLALETAYQHREIEQHAQALAQLRRYLSNMARNSARVAGG